MKINTSILVGLLFIIPSLIAYLISGTDLASLIAIIVGIFFFITGLFETNNYRNKNTYFTIIALIIAILLIITYNIILKAFIGNNLLPAVCLGAVILILIWLAYDFTTKWYIFKRKTMSFNSLGLVFLILIMGLITLIEVSI